MIAQPHSRTSWVWQMLHLKPARVPVGHTIRSALGVGLPFIIGALTGHIMAGMWIGLAALLMAPGEREGSHRLNLQILLISTPIAACGYLLGFAQGWPLWALVPLMAGVAFIAGAIASYGAAWSVAGMQFLLIAAVAIGVPGVDWWVAFGWYFVGGLFYLAMMLVEFAFDRRRPERNAVHGVVAALGALARARSADLQAMASGTEPAVAGTAGEARAKALGEIQAARTVAQTGHGRMRDTHWAAFDDFLDAAESLVAIIVGSQSRAVAERIATRLEQAITGRGRDEAVPAGAISHDGVNAVGGEAAGMMAEGDAAEKAGCAVKADQSAVMPDAIEARLADLEQAGAQMDLGLNIKAPSKTATGVEAHAVTPAAIPVPLASPVEPAVATPSTARAAATASVAAPQWNWARLALGRDALGAALRLALVYGVAVAARAYFPWAHWFWVPLTVCLVMKPDFGSVFDRAILRVVGTVIGVLISAAVIGIAQLPALEAYGSLVIAIAITLLAALVPWFMMRAYTLQAVAIAPIVVLLVAVIQPDGADTDYSMERIGATVVGGILVLVLGYALWPSARRTNVAGRIASALDGIEAYLAASMEGRDAGKTEEGAATRHNRLVTARRMAYKRLADLRVQLQRALAEAPPASTVAQAWLPAVTALERLVDGVGVVASRRLYESENAESLLTADNAAIAPAHVTADAAEIMQLLAQLRQEDSPAQLRALAIDLRHKLLAGEMPR